MQRLESTRAADCSSSGCAMGRQVIASSIGRAMGDGVIFNGVGHLISTTHIPRSRSPLRHNGLNIAPTGSSPYHKTQYIKNTPGGNAETDETLHFESSPDGSAATDEPQHFESTPGAA